MAITQVRAQIDGQWYTLTYNEATRKYEAELTPSATSRHQEGGYFNVTLEAANDTGVTAAADGGTLPGLRLVVRETTAPTLALVSPPQGYVTDSRPAFLLTAVDESGGSGVDPDSVTLLLDGTAVTPGVAEISGGFQISYTPAEALAEGGHTLTASAADYDGNRASLALDYTVDTVPPALYLEPIRAIVDDASIVISGRTNDATAPPVELTVGGKAVEVTAQGAFAHTAALAVGENHITVRAEDGAGLVTEAALYVIRLITDRTQGDVDRLAALLTRPYDRWTAEEAEWYNAGTVRGAYNTDDLNRVTAALEHLHGVLTRRGYLSPYAPVYPEAGRTTWEEEYLPAAALMQAYLANVAGMRQALPVPAKTPEAPADLEGFTFGEANDLEKILVLADSVFPLLDRSPWYAGEVFCGEA